MDNPLTSVIVPTHNRAGTLLKAVKSAARQSYRNLEIIVVDDGSSDNTVEILREHQKRECRLRVITQENRGVSQARNEALRNARGAYIALVDDDDRCLPRRLETQLRRVRELEKQSPGTPILCTSDYVAIHPELDGLKFKKVQCAGCDRIEVALSSGFPPPSTWFFSIQTLEALSEPSGKEGEKALFDPLLHAGEDVDLVIRARKLGARLTNIDEPLALYSLPRKGKTYRNENQSAVRILEKHGAWFKQALPHETYKRVMDWYQTFLAPDLYQRSMEKVNDARLDLMRESGA